MPELPTSIVIANLFGPDTDFENLAWQPFREGIEIIPLYGSSQGGPSAALLRYRAGAKLPAHQHVGFEHIIVLRGSQQDQNGVCSVGTLSVNRPGSSHTVFSEPGCVVLAIWEKPVHFLAADSASA
ncbi:MAG: anti-ECFsigma factor, ChrR [Phycisphaerales bacterium]|nr:anti-ECFsigma factor, ChrR [Phycisphaerales bacterium]